MAHTISFNRGLGVIVLRAKQSMNVDELERTFEELVKLPDFKEGLSLVVDFRGSTTPLTSADVRQLAIYAERTDAK